MALEKELLDEGAVGHGQLGVVDSDATREEPGQGLAVGLLGGQLQGPGLPLPAHK